MMSNLLQNLKHKRFALLIESSMATLFTVKLNTLFKIYIKKSQVYLHFHLLNLSSVKRRAEANQMVSLLPPTYSHTVGLDALRTVESLKIKQIPSLSESKLLRKKIVRSLIIIL